MSDTITKITFATAKKNLKNKGVSVNSFTKGEIYDVVMSKYYPHMLAVKDNQGAYHELTSEPNGWLEHFDIT